MGNRVTHVPTFNGKTAAILGTLSINNEVPFCMEATAKIVENNGDKSGLISDLGILANGPGPTVDSTNEPALVVGPLPVDLLVGHHLEASIPAMSTSPMQPVLTKKIDVADFSSVNSNHTKSRRPLLQGKLSLCEVKRMARMKAIKNRCSVLAKGKKPVKSALARVSTTESGSQRGVSDHGESSRINDYQLVGEAIGLCFHEKRSNLATNGESDFLK